MNKRAALELSVQSIVVFVLAFIVMGLIIGVINTMFGQITDQVSLIPSPGVELGGNPTADRPLLVQNGEITIPIRGDATAYFGIYYNRDDDAVMGTTWTLNATDGACQGFGITPVDLEIQRHTFTVDRTIQFGDILKFQTLVRLNDYDNLKRGDSLTCEMFVHDDKFVEGSEDPEESPIAYGTFIVHIR